MEQLDNNNVHIMVSNEMCVDHNDPLSKYIDMKMPTGRKLISLISYPTGFSTEVDETIFDLHLRFTKK